MEDFYWYENCPNCNQGRLIVTEDITNNRLYLHCEECEMGWLDPERANEVEFGFLTLLEEFETVNPDLATINRYGWNQYAKNKFTE
ncbi:hypothetical protein ACMXYN_09485 [Neptuniibacter sp. PT8_73]|uniref:hypothetical protein n=1 Tax=unclassified Neptuniibacter TaxID=2630693 RepID=UPI0039F69E7B